MADNSNQTSVTAEGSLRLRLPGADSHEVGTFEVVVPIVVTVGKEPGTAEALIDQDALHANLADALEAVAAELRKGA